MSSRNSFAALLVLAAALALMPTCASQAGQAHVHGEVAIDIAVENNGFTVILDSPLENLIGIERAPRNDVERKAVVAALASLRDAEHLFAADAAASCRATAVQLDSPVLGLAEGTVDAPATPQAAKSKAAQAKAAEAKASQTHAAEAQAAGAHADLNVRYSFACDQPARLTVVRTSLFNAFPRVSRIQVQLFDPRGQGAQSLRRPQDRIALTR